MNLSTPLPRQIGHNQPENLFGNTELKAEVCILVMTVLRVYGHHFSRRMISVTTLNKTCTSVTPGTTSFATVQQHITG